MAKASEYSMLFKLSAQLGREFGTTFSSAKRTLNDTQREINALNQTQADISAYQKQQQAVESTSRKLSDLQKEYEAVISTGLFQVALFGYDQWFNDNKLVVTGAPESEHLAVYDRYAPYNGIYQQYMSAYYRHRSIE